MYAASAMKQAPTIRNVIRSTCSRRDRLRSPKVNSGAWENAAGFSQSLRRESVEPEVEYTPLRIRLHTDLARVARTKHSRHHCRRRLGGGDAVAGTSKAPGCCRNRKRGHERRFEASRFLHVPVCDPVGWLAAECLARLVVGRSSGRVGDGSDHRQRGRGRNPGQGMLLRGCVPLNALPSLSIG